MFPPPTVRRAMMLFAFAVAAFRDVPDGFDELLIRRLAALGAPGEFARLSDLSIAGVVDLTSPPGQAPPDLWRPGDVVAKPLDGCVTIAPARRW